MYLKKHRVYGRSDISFLLNVVVDIKEYFNKIESLREMSGLSCH